MLVLCIKSSFFEITVAKRCRDLPKLSSKLGAVVVVYGSRCLSVTVHDPGVKDQQEVPEFIGVDHRTDQPVSTDGAETT
jgi:hypothetical protein